MASDSKKISISRLLFYLAGLLLVIKFVLKDISFNSKDVVALVASIFILVLVIGFYCFFLFGIKGAKGTVVSLAPSVLILALYGQYSPIYGDLAVIEKINSIGKLCLVFIVLVGFIFVFFHHKLLGYVLAGSSIAYAAYVLVSYIVMIIMAAVKAADQGTAFSFNALDFIATLALVGGLVCISVGSYRVAKRKDWDIQ